jgi:hypothetical protein
LPRTENNSLVSIAPSSNPVDAVGLELHHL